MNIAENNTTKLEINENTRFDRNPQFNTCLIDDELVCIDARSGDYFALNDTGTQIWSLLEKPSDLSLIVNTVAQDFPESQEKLLHDIIEFLMNLVSLGAVLIKDNQAASMEDKGKSSLTD